MPWNLSWSFGSSPPPPAPGTGHRAPAEWHRLAPRHGRRATWAGRQGAEVGKGCPGRAGPGSCLAAAPRENCLRDFPDFQQNDQQGRVWVRFCFGILWLFSDFFFKHRPPPNVNPNVSDVLIELFLTLPLRGAQASAPEPSSASSQHAGSVPPPRGPRPPRSRRFPPGPGAAPAGQGARCPPGATSRVAPDGRARGMKARQNTLARTSSLCSPGERETIRMRGSWRLAAGPEGSPAGDGGAGFEPLSPSLAFNATLARTDVPSRADCPDPAQLCPWRRLG